MSLPITKIWLDCCLIKYIKEGLVFDKNAGNLIGFVDLGDINNDFLRYSNSDSGSECKLPLAKSVMYIMVRSLTSG